MRQRISLAALKAALFVFVLFMSAPLLALSKYQGYVTQGGMQLLNSGVFSIKRTPSYLTSPYAMQSYPLASCTVYLHGTTTLAGPLFSDAAGTIPLGNPFAADINAFWSFYANSAVGYDIKFSGGGITSPWTLSGVTSVSTDLNYVRAIRVDLLATSGSGTLADPWAGWETSVNALPVGANIYFPAGYYTQAIKITVKVGWTVFGDGSDCDTLGVGSGSIVQSLTNDITALEIIKPINSANPINVTIRDIAFTNTTVVPTGTGFNQVGGQYVRLENVQFNGFKYGVVFDQTEIATIWACKFNYQTTGGLWLVNGADHTPGASVNFTNAITVGGRTIFQQSNPAIGVIDDGGITHSFDDCIFNGGANAVRIAGVAGLKIHGCEFEVQTSWPIVFRGTTLAGTVVSYGCAGAEISSNYVQPPVNTHGINVATSCYGMAFKGNSYVTSANFYGVVNTVDIFDWTASGETTVLGSGLPYDTGVDGYPFVITPTMTCSGGTGGTWTVGGGSVATFNYAQTGRKMRVAFEINTTTISAAPTTLELQIPQNKALAQTALYFEATLFWWSETGTAPYSVGVAQVSGGGSKILLQKLDGSAWGGTPSVFGTVDFTVNH